MCHVRSSGDICCVMEGSFKIKYNYSITNYQVIAVFSLKMIVIIIIMTMILVIMIMITSFFRSIIRHGAEFENMGIFWSFFVCSANRIHAGMRLIIIK